MQMIPAKNIFKSVLLMAITAALISFTLPKGWIAGGNSFTKYDMGVDPVAGQDGKNAATIKSIADSINGFGTLMQMCKADKYTGRKIKMTGMVKSEQVKGWAGLWLKINREGSRQHLAFDNMHDRPIKGTTEWTKYEIVLDVPANASKLSYGALLYGTGQIWFDNICLEVVGKSEKAKGTVTKKINYPSAPDNLDFEK